MLNSGKRIAFATLDIGTSQIKTGVYCPHLGDRITVLDGIQNNLVYGSSGAVRGDYAETREASFLLLKKLGAFLKMHAVDILYLGICGHVSSLLEWNKLSSSPIDKSFPIWLDATSFACLDEYNEVMGNGSSKQIIGTFLPAGTNWLFTKLLHRSKQAGFANEHLFLQVGDAIFYELSKQYQTHFSSQISMVNLKTTMYAPELLEHLKLDHSCLPSISYDPQPITNEMKKLFDFPTDSFVFPAMADLYTSLYGLRLKNNEGFMLANTSEQAGAFYSGAPKVLDNFLGISFNNGYVNYGSTNTGGNVVNWLLNTVLNKKVTHDLLDDLTTKAALINPADTPIILPYLQGERAPLWNSKLTASILELNSSHGEAHLFRAVLESIAFARRHCFEEIGINELEHIKLGGGSSKNNLWNVIRASVLNKRIAVADEKQLSIAGLIDYLVRQSKSDLYLPSIKFAVIEPNAEWIDIYAEKYVRFIRYQQLLT